MSSRRGRGRVSPRSTGHPDVMPKTKAACGSGGAHRALPRLRLAGGVVDPLSTNGALWLASRLRPCVGADVIDPKTRWAGRAGNELVLHRECDAHVEGKLRFREGREAGKLLAVEVDGDPVRRHEAAVAVELTVEHVMPAPNRHVLRRREAGVVPLVDLRIESVA